jgi:glycerophosphoryl diester phosphodiesterase
MLTKNNIIEEAKKRKLQVHPWYLRDEELYYAKDAVGENLFYLDSGVDGVLTEHIHLTM